jgi:hypothetical protein
MIEGGPPLPNTPVSRRSTNSIRRSVAKEPRIVVRPIPLSARRMIGRRPKRSPSRPEAGASRPQGSAVASTSWPDSAVETEKSCASTMSSGARKPIVVTTDTLAATAGTSGP